MMERATAKARDVDLAEIKRDAEARGIPLSEALGELIGQKAAELRSQRPKPKLGLFSAEFSAAQAEVEDEDAPASADDPRARR